jgi:hypothetical protein
MTVEVTFQYEPEPDEVDADDPSGLTEEAYTKLMDEVIQIGGGDVGIRQVK